ncbi:MAG: cysteine--tRNA ligase, partial [bacterium]|nr:cysteine--tRNA ligase [bacterium]
DVVKKYFKYREYEVTYVQNITDVDDKLIAQAIEENVSMDVIAKKYSDIFFEDCISLGAELPDHSPRATEYIAGMIDLIKVLIDKGFAYNVDGNVFFEVDKYEDYGKLSKKDFDHMEAGERVEDNIRSQKKDPARDFALWKKAKPDEPSWDSPWGKGRPGWHTECVVMSSDLLGKKFDIHTGGVDLIFPHHENEIAQAKCLGDSEFSTYWMHNEFVNLKGSKMAKSEGNVVLVHDLVKKFRPEAIRLYILQTHYRKKIDFDMENLQAAQNGIEKMDRVLDRTEKFLRNSVHKSISQEEIQNHKKSSNMKYLESALKEGMDSDFNTAIVIREMFDLIGAMDQELMRPADTPIRYITLSICLEQLEQLDSFMGILPKQKEEVDSEELERIELLIAKRNAYRANKDWENADKMRDELDKMGVILEDSKGGTIWRKKL